MSIVLPLNIVYAALTNLKPSLGGEVQKLASQLSRMRAIPDVKIIRDKKGRLYKNVLIFILPEIEPFAENFRYYTSCEHFGELV